MFRIQNFRGKKLTFLLMACFCAGELAGAMAYCASGASGSSVLGQIAEIFFRNKLGCTFIQTVVNSFSGVFLLVLICMLLGFGAIFQPFEAAVPFFHGLGIGVMLAEMNAVYGVNGFIVSVLMIIPYAVASAITVIAAAREAVFMSFSVGKSIFRMEQRSEVDFKLYFTKFLVLFGIAAFLSLADSVITYFFAGLWTRFLGI